VKLTSEVAFVFGTIILIIVSIAWVELLAIMRKVIAKDMNPLLSQFIFTAIITIIGILLLWWMQPFIDSVKDVKGTEKALDSEREILTRFA